MFVVPVLVGGRIVHGGLFGFRRGWTLRERRSKGRTTGRGKIGRTHIHQCHECTITRGTVLRHCTTQTRRKYRRGSPPAAGIGIGIGTHAGLENVAFVLSTTHVTAE
eukprot:scaffold3287_cov181-Amphora_coffeaeformis.AAC.4